MSAATSPDHRKRRRVSHATGGHQHGAERVDTTGRDRRRADRTCQYAIRRVRRLPRKTRLAALGTAVSKINHDLRNLLANAMLLSDSLDGSSDPRSSRSRRAWSESMERAAKLCSDTLNFSRAEKVEPVKRRFALKDLVDEVIATIDGQATSPIRWRKRRG